MRYLLLLLFLLGSSVSVSARCLMGEWAEKTQGLAVALSAYEDCALNYNDDASHFLLAQTYQKGEKSISPSLHKTLLFYHLSAENGNAKAQYQLARLLLELDETVQGRREIQQYLNKIQTALRHDDNGSFKGALLHPYTLLLLAAEKADQKWYYPSSERYEPEAGYFLARYQISDEKKRQALKDASSWKNAKMIEIAKSLMTADEYKRFYDVLYPQKGRADPYARSQALEGLKEKIQGYYQSVSEK